MPNLNNCIECDKPVREANLCEKCSGEEDKKNTILKYSYVLTRDRDKSKYTIKNFHKTREVSVFYNDIFDDLVTVAEGHNIVFGTRNECIENKIIDGEWIHRLEKEVQKYARTK